jgi:hypothetical protein
LRNKFPGVSLKLHKSAILSPLIFLHYIKNPRRCLPEKYRAGTGAAFWDFPQPKYEVFPWENFKVNVFLDQVSLGLSPGIS